MRRLPLQEKPIWDTQVFFYLALNCNEGWSGFRRNWNTAKGRKGCRFDSHVWVGVVGQPTQRLYLGFGMVLFGFPLVAWPEIFDRDNTLLSYLKFINVRVEIHVPPGVVFSLLLSCIRQIKFRNSLLSWYAANFTPYHFLFGHRSCFRDIRSLVCPFHGVVMMLSLWRNSIFFENSLYK